MEWASRFPTGKTDMLALMLEYPKEKTLSAPAQSPLVLMQFGLFLQEKIVNFEHSNESY